MNIKFGQEDKEINSRLDVNECMETPGVCHQYANCTNTDGNYSCECLRGFTGDGYLNCSGELKSNLKLKLKGNAILHKT
jgi:hypothetical protein